MDIKELEDNANMEMREIFKWQIEEENNLILELKEKGIYKEGMLDGFQEYFEPIKKEAHRRLNEIRKKYGYKPIDFK